MGFSIAVNSDFRHVPVHLLRQQLPDNSDEQKEANAESSSPDSSSHEQGENVEKPRRPRRIRIRVRRPVGRASGAGKTSPRKRRPPAPLLGPDLRSLSPLTQALLVGAFMVAVFLFWQFLHAFR